MNQPEEEVDGARSARVLKPGASVPEEPGCTPYLPGTRTCAPTPKPSKLYNLQIVRGVLSLRRDRSLTQPPGPLPPPGDGQGVLSPVLTKQG